MKKVEHITFSGTYATDVGQPVLLRTERAVLELTPQGPALMDHRIFHDRIMALRADIH